MPPRRARKMTDRQTPIAALAPVDSPLEGARLFIGEGDVVDVAEDCVFVVVLDVEVVDVIVEAADSTAALEA
jgi:hypothetical protein